MEYHHHRQHNYPSRWMSDNLSVVGGLLPHNTLSHWYKHNSYKHNQSYSSWQIQNKAVSVLNNHHDMKVCERVEVKLHAFLTSVLISGEWFILCPGHFNLGKGPWVTVSWQNKTRLWIFKDINMTMMFTWNRPLRQSLRY